MVVGHRGTAPSAREREDVDEADAQLSSAQFSLAGLLTGLATRALVQPLDVLKIRFQLQEEPLRGVHSGKYSGIVQALSLIVREEGLAALWKGHVPGQGLSAVYGLVQFASFEFVSTSLDALSNDAERRRWAVDIASGAVAGSLGTTAAMPFDVIRSRLIAQHNHQVYKGTIHAAVTIRKLEGMRGFFRGLAPSLAQIAPYTAIQFTLYNWCSATWTRISPDHDSSQAFVCGALAGTCSKMIVYPFDVVRHRMQMKGFDRIGFGRSSQYNGMMSAFVQAIRDETIYGLFKGISPSILKAAASSGLSFLFYDFFCDLLRSHKKK